MSRFKASAMGSPWISLINGGNMKFSNHIKTLWHDTDASRNVRPSKILEYMQETANLQCESSSLPLDALRDEHGLGFILGSLSLNILSPIHAYEEIDILTWCRPAKGYIFNRYFEIMRNGEKIAEASTVWVLLDIHSKSMVRASSYPFLDSCFYYDEPIDPSALPKKARIGSDVELYEAGKRKIVYSDIDYNMHMNNTHYPDMLCDFLAEMESTEPPYTVSSLSLSYLKESHLGDTLTVYRSDTGEDGTVFLRTVNSKDELCLEAVVKLDKT